MSGLGRAPMGGFQDRGCRLPSIHRMAAGLQLSRSTDDRVMPGAFVVPKSQAAASHPRTNDQRSGAVQLCPGLSTKGSATRGS